MIYFEWGGSRETKIEMEWKTGDNIWKCGDRVEHTTLPNGTGIVDRVLDRHRTENGSIMFEYAVSHH